MTSPRYLQHSYQEEVPRAPYTPPLYIYTHLPPLLAPHILWPHCMKAIQLGPQEKALSNHIETFQNQSYSFCQECQQYLTKQANIVMPAQRDKFLNDNQENWLTGWTSCVQMSFGKAFPGFHPETALIYSVQELILRYIKVLERSYKTHIYLGMCEREQFLSLGINGMHFHKGDLINGYS